MSFKWSWTGKAWSPEEREEPPCSWAVPAAARREAEPPWLTPPRVSHEEGGSGGLLCSGVEALLGTSYQSLVVEKLEISKEYSGFFCFVWDDQVFYHSFRKGCCQPFWRETSHKCTVFSAGRPSLQGHHKPGITGFPTKTQPAV